MILKMNKKLFFLSVISIVFIGTLLISLLFSEGEKRFKAEFDHFFQSNISGELIELKSSQNSNFKILKNELTKEFRFRPISKNVPLFNYTAKPGDSIFKPSYSDTLVLKKQGISYKYTFVKIE